MHKTVINIDIELILLPYLRFNRFYVKTQQVVHTHIGNTSGYGRIEASSSEHRSHDENCD